MSRPDEARLRDILAAIETIRSHLGVGASTGRRVMPFSTTWW